MTGKEELQSWLSSLEDDALIYIDDGGLTLRVLGQENVWYEVGGEPEEEIWSVK